MGQCQSKGPTEIWALTENFSRTSPDESFSKTSAEDRRDPPDNGQASHQRTFPNTLTSMKKLKQEN